MFEVVNVGAIAVHVHSSQVSDDCISGQLEDWIYELQSELLQNEITQRVAL